MITGLGAVFDAAASDTRTAEWGGVYMYLPDATWTVAGEGKQLAARSWKTLLNDPHLSAIAGTLVRQILGDGIWFRSGYTADPLAPTSDADRTMRKRINAWVAGSAVGTALDAGSMLTQPDLDAQLLLSGFFGGSGWGIRGWKPNRPGSPIASCWRVIDPDRVETPPAMRQDDNVVNGVRYVDGTADGIYVRRWSAATSARRVSRQRDQDYDYYRFTGKDGHRAVVHFSPRRWRAGSDLGIPALAAGLVLAHQLKELFRAHVSGKRIQASHPIVMPVKNPKKAAEEYQKMVEEGQADSDAQVLFVPEGSNASFTNASYSGADFEAVVNVYLRALCADIGYPWQFVEMQLIDANMAASQVAVDQADITSAIYQRQWIEQVLRHRDTLTIREGWALGAFGDLPDTPSLYVGGWQRPRRADVNRLRTRQAAELALKLGISEITIADEMGYDFEEQCELKAEARQICQRTGVAVPSEIVNAESQGAGQQPTPTPTDSGDDPPPGNQEKKDDTAQALSLVVQRDEAGRIVGFGPAA